LLIFTSVYVVVAVVTFAALNFSHWYCSLLKMAEVQKEELLIEFIDAAQAGTRYLLISEVAFIFLPQELP